MARSRPVFAACAGLCLGAVLTGAASARDVDIMGLTRQMMEGLEGDIPLSQWAPPPRGHVTYAGFDCTVDGMQPWSVKAGNGDEVAFEVRPGDRLRNPETGYQDPVGAERAELAISDRWANGAAVRVAYEFLIPSGFDFDARWTTVGQMHADLNVSPPVEFSFRSGSDLNALFMVVRTGDSAHVIEKEVPMGAGPVPRDAWQRVRMEARMGPRGYLRVWLNDVAVYNADGDTGFKDQSNWYWRMGLYRKASSTTYAIRYRGFRMSPL